MPDIVATSVVVHNLYIINKESIEEYWIVEAENKLCRRIGEGEIWEGNELRGKKAGIAEVKRMMLPTEDVTIADELKDEKTYFF